MAPAVKAAWQLDQALIHLRSARAMLSGASHIKERDYIKGAIDFATGAQDVITKRVK
jgi:hypothetical protein